MIFLRRTHLQPKDKVTIRITGIVDMVVGRTDEGIIYKGVEVLTKNVKHVNMLVTQSSLQHRENDENSHMLTKTDLGYLVYNDAELIQLNKHNEPVASIPIELFTALQFMSAKKYFDGEEVGTKQPIMEMSDYALTQIGLSPRNLPMIFEEEGFTYLNMFGNVVKYSKTFKEDREHIIKIYSNIQDPTTVIDTILNYKVYSLFSESKFLVWNDMLYKINNQGVELKGLFYV